MQRLGYRRYVAQGGDWGAFVTTAMAQQKAPGLVAIHLNFAQTIPDDIPTELLPDQKRAVEAMKAFREKGFSLWSAPGDAAADCGLCARRLACGTGRLDLRHLQQRDRSHWPSREALSRDDMLGEITLFWLTDTAASSARLYLEQAERLGKRNNPGRVDLPVGVSVFPHDLPPARSWAPQVYPRLFYWHELTRGGHFASLEVPECSPRNCAAASVHSATLDRIKRKENP